MTGDTNISSVVNLETIFTVLCIWIPSEVSDQTRYIGDVVYVMSDLQKIQILRTSQNSRGMVGERRSHSRNDVDVNIDLLILF